MKHRGSKFEDYYKQLTRGDKKLSLEIEIQAAKMSIANMIIIHRESLNLTQKRLAVKLGVRQQVISRIESGSNNITLDTLMRVANALNIALRVETVKRDRAKRVLELIDEKSEL